MNNQPEFNACLACKGQETVLLHPAYHSSMDGRPTGWWIDCQCYNYTKICDSELEAINAWNKHNEQAT